MASAEAALDLCVIGASEAGLAACLGGVALGLSCVLVDDGDPSGLRNPELTLTALAHLTAAPGRGATAWSTIADVLARGAAERRHARFGAMNVRLVRGTARFIDSTTLRAGDTTIQARRFIIATGGVQPSWRLAESLAPGVRLGVADLDRLPTVPSAPLVLGGTAEAIAVAQALARLGSRVTLAADSLLPGQDAELVAPLLGQLRQDGVVVLRARPLLIRSHAVGAAVSLSDGSLVEASHLVLAEEPRPALEDLDPARAGLRLRGDALVLDAGLRTTRRSILAIGRAAGARSVAEGTAQAGHALRAMLVPVTRHFRPDTIPTVTATHPEIASVGHVPEGIETRIWRTPLGQTGRAALDACAEGQLKVATNRRGRILWAGLVGPAVRDLVPFWTLAVTRGLTLADLGGIAVPSTSWSESIRALAVQDTARRLSNTWFRRVVAVARRLG